MKDCSLLAVAYRLFKHKIELNFGARIDCPFNIVILSVSTSVYEKNVDERFGEEAAEENM
jgi:hypothetical protein